jgi:hypothetical protein
MVKFSDFIKENYNPNAAKGAILQISQALALIKNPLHKLEYGVINLAQADPTTKVIHDHLEKLKEELGKIEDFVLWANKSMNNPNGMYSS